MWFFREGKKKKEKEVGEVVLSVGSIEINEVDKPWIY